MYRNIACAFDGSDCSRRALDVALHLARADQQKLWMIFIEEMPRYPGAPSETNEELERADAIFDKLRDEALDAGKKCGVAVVAEKRVGHPAQALVRYVKDAGVDLWDTRDTRSCGVRFSGRRPTRLSATRHVRCTSFDERRCVKKIRPMTPVSDDR
jgi:hypothetical protein